MFRSVLILATITIFACLITSTPTSSSSSTSRKKRWNRFTSCSLLKIFKSRTDRAFTFLSNTRFLC